MFMRAVPVLHVRNADEAAAWYTSRLGFRLTFRMRGDESLPDPSYTGIERDSVVIHLSSFSGDAVPGGVVNVYVDDVDALHAELVRRGTEIDSGPVDQTWGTREMYVKDPDRNCVRFVNAPAANRTGQGN